MYKIFNKIYKFVAYGNIFEDMLYKVSHVLLIWITSLFIFIAVMLALYGQVKIIPHTMYYILAGIFSIELIAYIVIRNYFGWLDTIEEDIRNKYTYLKKPGAWYDIRYYIVNGYTDDDFEKLNKQARKEAIEYQQKRIDKGEIRNIKKFKEMVDYLEVDESEFNIEHLK